MNYTNKNRLASLSKDTATLGNEEQEGYIATFQLLAAEVKQNIINGHDVTNISSLRERYVELLD